MACYHPRRVFLGSDRRPDYRWRADLFPEFNGDQVNLPCRRCLGCRTREAREWTLRAFHEGLCHTTTWRDPVDGTTATVPNSVVVTLTYAPEHLPPDGALRHRDFQLFMARLRKRRGPDVRYFMCGEYGGKTLRPHFHAILYGVDFEDTYEEVSLDGQVNRMSVELDETWKLGRATLDSLSFQAAGYVAGYVAKKAADTYLGPWRDYVDQVTGEVESRPIQPEYRKMSRGRKTKPGEHPRGGLGHDYVMPPGRPSRLPDLYATDSVAVGPWRFPMPRYYDLLLRRYRPDLVPAVTERRISGAVEAAEEWTPERASAAELVALAALQSRRDSL